MKALAAFALSLLMVASAGVLVIALAVGWPGFERLLGGHL